ncbi:MAG: S-layer homology domain-containing protein [Bacillota bacterium]
MKKNVVCRSVIKKAFPLFLSIVISIMTLSSAVSADTAYGSPADDAGASEVTDINKMAAALNMLNILRGENGDYMLDKPVSRAEAAVFIIRMLGKDDYVLQNAAQFKYTKFIDVVSSKWYAPYVGYCTSAGILAGTTDSTFEPEEITTEKQFLKMALCALGYEYGENKDFNWSNVYQKAYTIGIVTDSSYIDKIDDNKNYLRADAVAVIYRTLNTPGKGAQVKMIEALVNEGAFSRELAVASGMLDDEKPAEVDNPVKALSPTNVEVTMDQKITAVQQSDVLIYESSAPSNTLSVQSLAFMNNKIQVITSTQIPDKEYTIIIDNVTYENGYKSGRILGTFTGYVPKLVTSDFFRIMKVEQSASNVINVYFTHPVNENSEIAAYYELVKDGETYLTGSSQNITVKKIQSVDNAVSIYLKNNILAPGDLYEIKISGKLTSSYGVRLGEGLGDSIDIVAKAAEPGKFEVSSVQAWTSMTVRIVFSCEVNRTWAEKRINYMVSEKDGRNIDVTKAVVGGTGSLGGREVLLSLASPLDRGDKYELSIEFIPDIYNQGKIEGKTYTFSGAYPTNMELELKQAVSEQNNSVVLTFNRALDCTSASNNKNYVIHGKTDEYFSVVPKKAYYSEKNGVYTVKLFLPEGVTFKSSHRYVVYAADIKDALGEYPDSVCKAEFTGGKSSVVKPRIADAVTVSKNAIKLVFNIEIAFSANNISISNYSLEYVENGEVFRISPLGVIYVDPNTVVLHFDELDPSTSYQLKFNSITDYSEVYTRTASDGDTSIAVRFGR